MKTGRAQQGMVLMVVLVFLVLLMLFGTWAVRDGAMQEKMAGNTRNQDLALQAAEFALRDAEATMDTWRAGPFNGSNGLSEYDATLVNTGEAWRDASRWQSFRTTAQLDGVAEQPRYRVERMPVAVGGEQQYRVTARGVGAEANSVVILQAMYAYR